MTHLFVPILVLKCGIHYTGVQIFHLPLNWLVIHPVQPVIIIDKGTKMLSCARKKQTVKAKAMGNECNITSSISSLPELTACAMRSLLRYCSSSSVCLLRRELVSLHSRRSSDIVALNTIRILQNTPSLGLNNKSRIVFSSSTS